MIPFEAYICGFLSFIICYRHAVIVAIVFLVIGFICYMLFALEEFIICYCMTYSSLLHNCTIFCALLTTMFLIAVPC